MLTDKHVPKIGPGLFLILVLVGAQYNFALTVTLAFLVSAVAGLIALRKAY
jgi:hypothetical protein